MQRCLAPVTRRFLRKPVTRRFFCAVSDARALFPSKATKAELRAKYYELAKATHPDSRRANDDGAIAGELVEDDDSEFLAVQQAYEELMAEVGQQSAKATTTTAASSAARGGAQPRRQRATVRPSAGRPPTLGEILCERLVHEPSAFAEVWADAMERRLDISSAMTCAIFKACATSGAGMRAALTIFREATAEQVLTQQVRTTSLVSLLTLCKEENLDVTFEVVDLITDDDKLDPELFAALSSTFSFFPSGASF